MFGKPAESGGWEPAEGDGWMSARRWAWPCNTDYVNQVNPLCPSGRSGIFCAGAAGVDMAQFFVSPSYAHRFSSRVSLGAAPIFAIQRLKVRGLNSLAARSGDPARLSDQGYDYSYGGGVRVGILFEPLPGLRFGASYRTETVLKAAFTPGEEENRFYR